MKEQIRAGIFDVGGVLQTNEIKYVYADIMKTLGINEDTFRAAMEKIEQLLSKGQISEQEFWNRFKAETKAAKDLPKKSLWLREFEKRFTPNDEVLKIVKRLKAKGLKLAVCSNTIAPHVAFLTQQGIFDDFDVRVFSNEVGIRKPDTQIYLVTLERLGAQPSQAFYVDDDAKYLDEARSVGIHSLQFLGADKLKTDLGKLGIKL